MTIWYGWGAPGDAIGLPPQVAALLEHGLGVKERTAAVPAMRDVRLPPATLDPSVRSLLENAIGAEHVLTADEDRIRHTGGKSTVDLLRLRAGDASGAPDAVLRPGSHDDVLAVLRLCSEHRIPVVPYGGGTSVVGGLAPAGTGWLALDLGRLDRLVSIDPLSRIAVLEPGLRAPAAEALLAREGFTLGHFPQSFEYASIGGFAATRSSGQFSAGYGRFDDMVVALRVATPQGTVELGRAPRSAAGPDLRQLFLGSEGTLGVITQLSLRVQPATEPPDVDAWAFPSFIDGVGAARRLAQDGPLPTMVRVSDEYETATGGTGMSGCLVVVAYEGPAMAQRSATSAVLRDCGGAELPPEVGQGWRHSRYQGPYLRDALLDAGALAETVETATFWSRLPALYEAVREALIDSLGAQGTPPAVLCHVSHVYGTGASLYFTVVCAQADDPVAQWRAAKQAANEAIVGAGGTITHHHGVGTDHAAGFAAEVGPLGVATLRAVKRELDPAGILNPGILLG
jgi:alkyldihydroxyacetonephosphate synthase